MGRKTFEGRKQYRLDNKEKLKNQDQIYRRNHRTQINIKNRQWELKNLISWEGFIPKETECQICSKKIYFNQRDNANAIHFDHKKENLIVNYSPTSWLKRHKRTDYTEKIWKEFNFGMLCRRCNNYLPTKDRVKYIKKVVAYVFENKL